MESSDFRNPEDPQDEAVPNLQETQPHLVPIENLPLPWCFRCKTFSHRVMDCRELRRDQNEMLVANIITDDNFAHQNLLPSLNLSSRCSNLS
jgi:hypothetical protein